MSPPLFATRTLYAPGHFGNSYEVVGDNEFRTLLTAWQSWGFNEYADWFDPANCADPYVEPLYDLGKALRDAKKRRFVIAQELGLPGVLVLTPNTVFQEQCAPDVDVVKSERIFGQLVCPSIPRGRAIILRNHENWFRDLASAGVKLRAIAACPYDFGGCACDQCNPWILTFAKLCREIHALAECYHPDVEMRMIGWWWSAEEHRLFADWADTHAPGWVKSITQHIPYDQSDEADVPLPKGCERQAFVHIGYAEEAAPRDTYAHLGPVMAADRLERTLHALRARGCTGWLAYSEGVYDDVNKALLVKISGGQCDTAGEVLVDYAKDFLGADDRNVATWVHWLRQWGRPYSVDTAAAELELAKLQITINGTTSWRIRQWQLKSKLMRANTAVLATKIRTPERAAAIAAYWAVHEVLVREVYGIGLLRHIFARDFSPTPWMKEEREFTLLDQA
jgi:hypothetical protein